MNLREMLEKQSDLGMVSRKSKVKKQKLTDYMNGENNLTEKELACVIKQLGPVDTEETPVEVADSPVEQEESLDFGTDTEEEPEEEKPRFKMLPGFERFQPVEIEEGVFRLKASRFVDPDNNPSSSGTTLRYDIYMIAGTGIDATDPAIKKLNTLTNALEEHILEFGVRVSPLFVMNGEIAIMIQRFKGSPQRLHIHKGDAIAEMRIL